MCLEDKDKSFAFEKSFCLLRSEVWLHEARNLFYSADVLYEFEWLKREHLFKKNEGFTSLFPADLTDSGFFSWRIQRMLWAYGFENIFKCIVVTRYRQATPGATEVPFSEIKSHNLPQLANKAGFQLEEPQVFYLGLLQKCALWAGRYPLPVKAEHMHEKREALPSRESLQARSIEVIERHLRGEIPRIFTESDVLHSQMGAEELQVCRDLRQEAISQAESILKNHTVSQQGAQPDAFGAS